MPYEPIRCPACGSVKTIAAESKRFYCASCDGWFAWAETVQTKQAEPARQHVIEAMQQELRELRELVRNTKSQSETKGTPKPPPVAKSANPPEQPPADQSPDFVAVAVISVLLFILVAVIIAGAKSASSQQIVSTDNVDPATKEEPSSFPKHAVTKGSFTIWTVPSKPAPGQKYTVMLRIKLNSGVNLSRYPLSDLSGSIVGTDGYKDYFAGPAEAVGLPIKDNAVQVQAFIVPGASQLVKDVITLESKLLQERQTIEIEFGGIGAFHKAQKTTTASMMPLETKPKPTPMPAIKTMVSKPLPVSPPAVYGKVLATDGEGYYPPTHVEISLGSCDGLAVGNELEVYSLIGKGAYLGRIKLVEVFQNQSIGTVVFRNKRYFIQAGDNVSTRL